MHDQQDARLEDLLDGPWSSVPLFSDTLWSAAIRSKAFRASNFGESEVSSCLTAIHNDLEVVILLSLAVRSGYISVGAARAHVELMTAAILSTPGVENFLFNQGYWAVMEIVSRLNLHRFRSSFPIPPISSNLQLDFVSVLTTHRSLRMTDATNDALSLLNWGLLATSDASSDSSGSGEPGRRGNRFLTVRSLLEELRPPLKQLPDGGDSPALSLLRGIFDFVESLARLFMPMGTYERGALGGMYVREIRTLNHGVLTDQIRLSHLFVQTANSFETFEKAMIYHASEFECIGSKASIRIPQYLMILTRTLRNVEHLYGIKRDPTGSGGGGLQTGGFGVPGEADAV